MTIQNLTQEIFEKSFSRESFERLLTKEIKKKLEYALAEALKDNYDRDVEQIIDETLKSE